MYYKNIFKLNFKINCANLKRNNFKWKILKLYIYIINFLQYKYEKLIAL